MEQIESLIESIQPLNYLAMATTLKRLDNLTKPVGSLGGLEKMVCQLAGIQGTFPPALPRKALVLMAADHGVTAEGVAASPPEVTEQMLYNFIRGGAAINVLSRHANADLVVVDVGVKCDFPPDLPIMHCKVRRGTDNMRLKAAMSREDVIAAIKVGITMVESLASQGYTVIGLGEMGIGNTTASSAITSVFTGKPVSEVVGKGGGIPSDRIAHKVRVVEEAIANNKPNPQDAIDVLAKVGGLEIAAMAGVVLAAAANRMMLVIDGFISSSAVLAAYKLSSRIKPYLLATHLSEEPGHQAILDIVGLTPFLHLNMCLGEGTGGVLGMTVLDAAVKILHEMATFEEARVSPVKSNL